MTRKELELREKAVLYAYKYSNINQAAEIMLQLYQRNITGKLYRFRPPRKHEISAMADGKIYLCRPYVYEDMGDCQWIDDIKALVEYDVKIRNQQKYARIANRFTPEKYEEIVSEIQRNQKYLKLKDTMRNMCLIACVTDKMTDYMWREYASEYEGVCLEYNFLDVLDAIVKLNIRLNPVRYVEDRTQTVDIKFGPTEYADDADEELMHRKYMISCMTKDKIPYSNESEWRIFCEKIDISQEETGELFDFIRPGKIYLGKNISKNEEFEKEIRKTADRFGIELVEMM